MISLCRCCVHALWGGVQRWAQSALVAYDSSQMASSARLNNMLYMLFCNSCDKFCLLRASWLMWHAPTMTDSANSRPVYAPKGCGLTVRVMDSAMNMQSLRVLRLLEMIWGMTLILCILRILLLQVPHQYNLNNVCLLQ